MSRRPGLGEETGCSRGGVPARFLPLREEGDGETHAGQGGEAARGQRPRWCAVMATAGSGEFSQTMARGGGEERGVGVVQGVGRGGLSVSMAGGSRWREGPAGSGVPTTGCRAGQLGAGEGGRRQGWGWTGLRWAAPQASFNLFQIVLCCCLCYFFLVINLLTLAFL